MGMAFGYKDEKWSQKLGLTLFASFGTKFMKSIGSLRNKWH